MRLNTENLFIKNLIRLDWILAKNNLFRLNLFTLDEQGKPRVQAYEVKPAEIVPKQ